MVRQSLRVGSFGGHGVASCIALRTQTAVIGGVGANLAENKWHEYKEKKEERLSRDEQRYEQRWDGRSRSNVK